MITTLFVLLGSCALTKRHYSKGWHVEWHKRINARQAAPQTKIAVNSDPTTIFGKDKTANLLLQSDSPEPQRIVRTSPKVNEIQLSDTLQTAIQHQTTVSEPEDTLKKRNKWVPYKVRREQAELEQAANDEEIKPKKWTVLTILLLVISSLFIAYSLFGGVFLLTVFGMLLLDSGVTILFLTYAVPFVFAWWLYAEITVLMVRIWSINRKEKTYKAFRKRVLFICRLVAIALALITIIVIGLYIL